MAFQPRVEKVEYYACTEKECKYHSIQWANGCSRYPILGLCRRVIKEKENPEVRCRRQLYESRRGSVQERYEKKGALGELYLRMNELASMMRDVSYLMDEATRKIPNDKGRGTNEDDGETGAAD